MIDNLQTQLERVIFSGPLKAVNVFQVNDTYFHFPEKGVCIIDGGIELIFPKGVCCIAWSSDYESFVFEPAAFEAVYLQPNFVQLNIKNDYLNRYIGRKATSVKFNTIDIESIIDYTMRTQTEERLVSVLLEFDDENSMQIALVDYDLEEGEAPKNFIRDLYTDILISTREFIEVK
jgi:hypothetical protein